MPDTSGVRYIVRVSQPDGCLPAGRTRLRRRPLPAPTRARPGSVSIRTARSASAGATIAAMPTPMLKTCSISAAGDLAALGEQGEHRGRLPGRPVQHRARATGQDPGQIRGQPAAGHVGERPDLTAAASARQSLA